MVLGPKTVLTLTYACKIKHRWLESGFDFFIQFQDIDLDCGGRALVVE